MNDTKPYSYEYKKSILSQLDKNIHISISKENNEDKTCIEHGYGDLVHLIDIEKFIDEVLINKEMPYDEITNKQNQLIDLKENYLSKYKNKVKLFLSYSDFNETYDLSEGAKLFFRVAKEFPYLGVILEGPVLIRRNKKVKAINENYRLFNAFIQRLRERANEIQFNYLRRKRERMSRLNTVSAVSYVDQLFEQHARLLMVRVDVAYYKNYVDKITPSLAREHRQRLLNNMGVKGIFNDCVGFIWKLEYGKSKGFHYHFIFFFNGSKRKKDKFIADQIGEYWMNDITQGLGVYHNANRNKYPRKATGMIKHDDMVKRSYLTEIVIPYLTKQEQYLMAKQDGMRTFGKGVIKKEKGNMGRPRKENLVSV